MNDEIELPATPNRTLLRRVMPDDYRYGDIYGYTVEQMRDYGRVAVELDRQQRREAVGSFIWDGDEWRMVAAEYQSDQDVVVLYRYAPHPAEPVVKQSLTTDEPATCCADPRPDCMGMLVEGIGNRCAALAQPTVKEFLTVAEPVKPFAVDDLWSDQPAAADEDPSRIEGSGMIIDTKHLRRLLIDATKLPWMLATSNSWRRIVDAHDAEVCTPCTQPDGHPDLYFAGGFEGVNAELLIDAVNALPELLDTIDALEQQVNEYARIAEQTRAEADARVDAQAAEIERLNKALRVAVLALANAVQDHGKVYQDAYEVVDAALKFAREQP